MLHIINPEYTWFLMYLSLFVTFIFYTIRQTFSLHSYILSLSLMIASVINVPYLQEYIEPFKVTIFEANLTIASFALIARYFSKKLLMYLFSITAYLTGMTITHIMHLEHTVILPALSLFLIVTLFLTYISLPYCSHAKNGMYFITIFIFILHNTIVNAAESTLMATCYIITALCIAARGFFTKNTQEKVFNSFLSFLVIGLSYVFIQNVTDIQVAYTVLYATIAYFLYKTSKDKHPVFFIYCIATLVHACYIILNPSYFLLHTIYSQTISYPVIRGLITFTYSIIIISIGEIVLHTYKETSRASKIDVVKFIFILFGAVLLLEVEIFHLMLSDITHTTYAGFTLTMTLHIFYILITYTILMLVKILLRKQRLQKFIKSTIPKPLPTIPSFVMPSIKYNIIFATLNQNLKNIYEYTFAIIPIFVLFYLIISFIY